MGVGMGQPAGWGGGPVSAAMDDDSTRYIMNCRKLLVVLLTVAVALALGAGWALAKKPVQVKSRTRVVTTKARIAASEVVDINSATIKQLQEIKGIGPVLAERIVKYRKLHGPFKTKADIQKIKGIGPVTYDKIKAHIKAGHTRR
jgi:comEA protein